MSPSPPTRTGARATSAVLGAAIAAGWTLHDHALLAVAGDPVATLDLLPASLAAVAGGALLGLVLRMGHRTAFTVFLALGLASVLPSLRDVPFARAQILLPRYAVLIGLGVVTGRVARVQLGVGTVRFGLCAGVLLCVAKTAYRLEHLVPLTHFFLGGSVLALGAGLSRAPGLRLALTAVGVALPAAWTAMGVRASLESTRPDVSLRAAEYRTDAPSLLVVVLDSVRADHLASYGYGRVTTPGLDAFAEEHATRYANVRATSSWTLPSVASLLTGLEPARHGATHPRNPIGEPADALAADRAALRPAQPVRTDVPTLGERLAAEGYRTGAIVADSAYLDHSFGLDRGFEHYDDRPGSWLGEYVALGQTTGHAIRIGHQVHRDAEEITDRAIDWLDRETAEGERPFLLMLDYMDAHAPYFPPWEVDGLFDDAEPVDPLQPARELHELLYDRCLAYLDSQIGRLLDHLRATGRFDDTAIVVTSDHGEAFGEHGFWTHGWTLYDELLRVPLLVKPSGGRSRNVDETPLTLVGVHDLVLELVGLESDREPAAMAIVGEWFHPAPPASRDVLAWAEATGRDLEADLLAWIDAEGRKWIVASSGAVEAYDLASDPGELEPLELNAADVEAALERARAWWEAYPPRELDLDE